MGRDGREAWRIIQELLFEGETHDRIHSICTSFGLTPGLAKALVYLSPDGGVAMRELAEHWGCDASYITALVDGLEQRGMAQRRPNPGDRRVKAVALTEAGAAAKASVLDRMWEPPKAFEVLTPDEEGQLRGILEKVAMADPRIRDARSRSWTSGGLATSAGSEAGSVGSEAGSVGSEAGSEAAGSVGLASSGASAGTGDDVASMGAGASVDLGISVALTEGPAKTGFP